MTLVVTDVQGTIGEKWPSMDNAEVLTGVLAQESAGSTVEYVLYAHGRCILETRRRGGWAYNT